MSQLICSRGWSGGAMVLGKLPVPGRPTNLDYSRARAYCACSGCGWGLFGHFLLVYHFSFLSPSLWEKARYRLKYCLKGPLSPKQLINQPYAAKEDTDLPVCPCSLFSEFSVCWYGPNIVCVKCKESEQTTHIYIEDLT